MNRHSFIIEWAGPIGLSAALVLAGCADDFTRPEPESGNHAHEFLLRAPGADSVFVEGSFNQWTPVDEDWRLELQPDSLHWSLSRKTLPPSFDYHYAVYAPSGVVRVEDPLGTRSSDIRLDPFQTRIDPAVPTPLPLLTAVDPARLVIYELLVEDFSDDATFDAIRNALDDPNFGLADLGINAIELLPIHPSPADFTWGYDCGSHFSVDPQYGGTSGLIDLVEACHERGIAVFLDVVLNHASGHHPIQQIEWVTGESHFFDPESTNPFGLPEFDWSHPEVPAYFVEALSHFVDNVGIDGFRYDYIEGEPYEHWAQVVLPLREALPSVFHIAESFDTGGNALASSVGFDAQWGGKSSEYGGQVNNYHQRLNSNLVETAYERREGGGSVGDFSIGAQPMRATADVTGFHPARGPWKDIHYLESHDERRVVESVENSGTAAARNIGGIQKSRLGALHQLTSVGIPMLYHGQEIGVDNTIGADPAPSPIDWSRADMSLRTHYRNLIHLRLEEPALSSDRVEFLWRDGGLPSWTDENDRTLIYLRGEAGAEVLVALNFDHEDHEIDLSFPQPGTWALFDPATGARDELVETDPEGHLSVTIAASDGLIYLRP